MCEDVCKCALPPAGAACNSTSREAERSAGSLAAWPELDERQEGAGHYSLVSLAHSQSIHRHSTDS